MHLVEADYSNYELLAHMNKQLIEDEQHDNTMTIDQLGERMKAFLTSDYKVAHIVCFAPDLTLGRYNNLYRKIYI